MKKREKNALLKKITTKDYLDVSKIPMLTHDERSRLVYEIVSKRLPVVVELIPESFDMQWLYSCGYYYTRKNKNYTFLCNSEAGIYFKE